MGRKSNILTFILLIAFLIQTFHQASIVADYYANTSAYAQNCENKAKPQMHCNGKCQMMRKLKKESQKDQQNPERNGSVKKQVLSSKSYFASITSRFMENQLVFNEYRFKLPNKFTSSIFHPPGHLLA